MEYTKKYKLFFSDCNLDNVIFYFDFIQKRALLWKQKFQKGSIYGNNNSFFPGYKTEFFLFGPRGTGKSTWEDNLGGDNERDKNDRRD
jgi:hypothetical protein